jgi:hypothetical protein
LALLLVAIFSISFLTVFLTISFTQSAHSIPSSAILDINGMKITVGPPPNSTNIPLDTTISIDALASATLNDLQISPQVLINYQCSETSGPLTYLTTFYPSQPLKTTATYTVSVNIFNTPVSWSFRTTSETFEPGIGFHLATNCLWIALLLAFSVTLIVIIVVRLKKIGQPKN